MDRPSSFREWIVKRLRYQIDLQEKSVAAVEKEMGWSRGYLGDALRGEKRLALESLLEVLDHLGVDFGDFFSGTTPEEEKWGKYPRPSEVSTTTGVADAAGAPRGASGPGDDTRSLVLAVIRVLEAKGVLDQDDLMSALAERKG